MIQVKAISAQETLPLRCKVLRPGRPVDAAMFAGDDDAENQHFGVFLNEDLVGVASLFRNPLPEAARRPDDDTSGIEWQLRGMAIEPRMQKSGLGKALLRGCIDFVTDCSVCVLWCNARTSALWFYQNNGFETRGEEFVIPDVGPHFVMVFQP